MNGKNRKASPEILWRLASNLKRLREARGYTQAELGHRSGFAKSYVCNVESEMVNISLANLEALAIGLNCSECDLLASIRATISVQR